MSDKSHLFTSNRNLRADAAGPHYAADTRDEANPQAMANAQKTASTQGVHPLDGRKMGQAAHQVIAEVLEAGRRKADFKELQAVVSRHPSSAGAIVYRQSARQRLVSAAQAYFKFCLPPDSWTFVGAEVSGPSCRFDLVWLDPEGSYWADELKTGRTADRTGRVALAEQVERERVGGLAMYGEGFGGIRVCIVVAPKKSHCILADGSKDEGRQAWRSL